MTDDHGASRTGPPGPLIAVDDPADARLAGYRHLNDTAFRRRLEETESIVVVEGKLAVERLLESTYRVRSLLVDDRRAASVPGLVEEFRGRAAPVFVGSGRMVADTVGFDLHRGVVALAHRPPPVDADALIAVAAGAGRDHGAALVAVAEGLNDHENIGALFRNAAAFGVAAVLLDPSCADPLYRRSVRVSMGHVLHVPFARLDPWPGGLDRLRRGGFTIAALTPDPASAPHHGPVVSLTGLRERMRHPEGTPVAVLVGAEGPGLSASALAAADAVVSIPMAHRVDSLNVATAAAVAFHAVTHP